MFGRFRPNLRLRKVELILDEPLPLRPAPAYLVTTSADEFRRTFGVSSCPPAVDWEREVLIVVERGECPTGGYTVSIDAASLGEGGRELTVEVSQCDPGPADFVSMVVTYPRAAATLARRGLHAVRRAVFVAESGAILHTAEVTL